MANTATSLKHKRDLLTLKNYRPPRRTPDYSIFFGLGFFILVLGVALTLSGSVAAFADFRAFLIVILGTVAIMGLSFDSKMLKNSLTAIREHLFQRPETPHERALNLMDVASLARREGHLKIGTIRAKCAAHNHFLRHGLEMVEDDIPAEHIDRLLNQEIDAEIERMQAAIALLRRGAEAAPAMGLIGTLIGLVQMLSTLDDPSTIGPAMAVALLTTFYGALLGSALFAPLAGKLELQLRNLILRYDLVVATMVSIAKKENPRTLEQVLNSKLPAAERIYYYQGEK
tara:strand:+ start:2196 stop:3053 length:858 start_codon:yes stop_codon:yes gene_type:complete